MTTLTMKEGKMDEIKEIEEKILNYEQDGPNSDEEAYSRYMGLKYWCKVLLSRIKELEEEVDKLTLSKQDAEGQLNILRPEYCKLQERIKELEAIIAETKRRKTDEEIMKLWDTWRKYIANGGTASWPRDAFENVISWYEERIKKLVGGIEKVLQWRNFDGDGITDPLRMELYKLIEKEKP